MQESTSPSPEVTTPTAAGDHPPIDQLMKVVTQLEADGTTPYIAPTTAQWIVEL